ncbi:MAG: CHAT domain-containing protein [Bryobacteraceae bacterium]
MRLVVAITGFVLLAGCSQIPFLRTTSPDPELVWASAAFKKFRASGLLALERGDYRTAIDELTAGADAAKRAGDAASEGRFLANLSTAYLLRRENRTAIQTLLAARAAAGRASDLSTMQAVEANLANLYIQTGDNDAAATAALRGVAIRPRKQDPVMRITILLSFGRAISKARGLAAAEPLLREALLEASIMGSLTQEAEILDLWGHEAMETERYGQAEDLLARAWFKRKAANDPRLALTEGKLGRLYRKMGRYTVARIWMDRVRAAGERGRKIPVAEWSVVAEHGHVYAGEGRLRAALESYREAMDWARRWRQALPPAERLRLGAERRLLELIEGHLRVAGRLYRQRPDARLSAEMFTLIQTTRAWSLEKSHDAGAASEPMYAEARRLEGQWLAGNGAAAHELKIVRAAILEREVAAAGPAPEPVSRLEAPKEGEAVLTYWLDDEGSWLWVWTKAGLRVTSLPRRERILREADSFRAAILNDSADAGVKGERLMETLLGRLRTECLRATRWDVVADAGLFQLPFAALPAGNGKYLAERMEVRLVPNALRRETGAPVARRFLVVADPIFNAADERRPQPWFWQRRVHAGDFARELPRLPGTRREGEAALAAWRKAGYETAIHLGSESGEEAVLARLSEWHPGIVHVATHTATPPNDAARPRLALSMRPDGTPGLLAAEDIAALPLRAELVVLSACHATGGETAKGSGLLGLTRAWLTAGSRQVISTLWPVGDESTAFFSTFYERLASGDRGSPLPVASALRQAQLACIRGGGVSAQPRNWAGHILLARR